MTIAAYVQTDKGSKHTYRKLERIQRDCALVLAFQKVKLYLCLIFINLNSVDCSHEIRECSAFMEAKKMLSADTDLRIQCSCDLTVMVCSL